MNKKGWILFGAGHFLHDIIDAIEANNEVVACIVLNQKVDPEILNRIPKDIKVIDIENFKPSNKNYFFGFMNQNKKPLLEKLTKYNLKFANLIHLRAYLAKGVSLGQGNFVGANAVIGPNTKLGNYNIINRLTSIGHDVKIGDLNNFGPGAVVSGRCTLGNNNFLGANSTIIPLTTIKDEITIGAGAVVVDNIDETGTYIGMPARKNA